MNKVNSNTLDVKKEKIDQLKEILPEIFVDEKIDFNKFEKLFKDDIDNLNEKYEFTWNGKNDSKIIANMTSTSTLLPCKEKSYNWNKAENIYIEGDNLEVLKILQKSYYKKIKMIYIDPPYNTGNDFVYKDKFSNTIENYKELTKQQNKAHTEAEGRFHTDWLNMIYPRLKLARNLLKSDGVLFISIDDNEITNLLKICEEIFGYNNVEIMIWDKVTGNSNAGSGKMKITYRFRRDHEYVVVCYKNKSECFFNKPLRLKTTKNEYGNIDNDPRGNWISSEICKSEEKSNPNGKNYFTLTTPTGTQFTRQWHYSLEELQKLISDNRIYFGNGKIIPRLKRFLSEPAEVTPSSIIQSIASQTDGNRELLDFGLDFDNPKPIELIKWLIEIGSSDDDIILDFFSGSGTTADTIIRMSKESNRKFILVQLPEYISDDKNICDIGETRIKKSIEKYSKDKNEIGFKVFKLDKSNIKIWNDENLNINNANKYFYEHMDPIVEGRTEDDLLYEILLKEGIMLSQPVEEKIINDKKLYSVDKGYMIACLIDNIDIELVREIGKLKPETVIFKDSGFIDENAKANALQELKKMGIEEEKVKSI